MKVWHLIVLVVAVLAALILLILNSYYAPSLEEAKTLNYVGSTAENRSSLDITPENGRPPNILFFCSDPWPPYAGHSHESRQGYIVDVIREIYEPLGYDVRYVNKPWSRCISETRTGKLSALAGADVDEVPDFVFPQETIGVTRPAFFVLKETAWTYQGLDSLATIKLGMIQDYTNRMD